MAWAWAGTVRGDTGSAGGGRFARPTDRGLERQEGPWGEHNKAEGKDVQLPVLLLCLFFIFRVFF